MKWHPCLGILCLMCMVLCLGLTGRSQAGSAVQLPAGVKAVWDMNKAYRETTPTRERICINGLWRWQPVAATPVKVPEDNWGFVKVPGVWPHTLRDGYLWRESQTLYPHPSWKNQQMRNVVRAFHQREITIPAAWAGRRIAVYAEYVNSLATVFVDGRKMGDIVFPWGEVDITSACKPGGKHMLSLYVAALPLKATIVAFRQTGQAEKIKGNVARRGLCGDVYLVSTPAAARIGDVKIDTSVRRWEIAFDVSLRGLDNAKSYRLRAKILDGRKEMKTFTGKTFTAADLKTGRITSTHAWRPTRLWDVHTPQDKYTLQLSLLDAGGNVIDTFQDTAFGFREFWIKGRDFYLNGSRFYCFAIPLDNAQIGPLTACYAGARESFKRLLAVGVNMVYTHNYGCQPGAHVSFEEIFKAADDTGMLISLSQPHYRSYDWKGPDAEKTNGYARHAEFYVRMAQNHPCVTFYSMNHNACGYANDMNPDLIDGIHNPLGEAAPRKDNAAILGERAADIVRRFDRTRIIYHHASGNLGSMHTSNFYINFVPIQERSDWFEHWATSGVKPVFPCEYGVPLGMGWTSHRGWETGVIGKGKRSFTNGKHRYQFYTAEWGAQFRGDAAFALTEPEKRDIRFEAKKWGAGQTWFRWDYPFPVHAAPLGVDNIDAVQARYITDNWRAYRTWGMSAFNLWGFGSLWKLKEGAKHERQDFAVDWDAIQRPGYSLDYANSPYERMDTGYKKTDWLETKAAKAFIRNNQPLLAYIAGKPSRFTSKDHNFLTGETVEKQIIIINNTRRTVSCDCTWSLALPQAVKGSKTVSIETGEQARLPLKLALPAALKPRAYVLGMQVKFSTGETQEDRFAIHVLPRNKSAVIPGKIAVFDPEGQTTKLLGGMGLTLVEVGPNADLAPYAMLIIGKHGLTVSGPAPNIDRVKDGLKVLVFEQRRAVLEKRLGFRVQAYGLRRVFERVPDHPVLTGLQADNLRDWRGRATTMPPRWEVDFNQYSAPLIEWCGLKVTRGWRCGCWGNVASVLIEKPARGNFLPIVDGGFGLQYSPLLEYREGKGIVFFCQMDVTGRSAADPAAMQLVRNAVAYVAAFKPAPQRTVLYAGEASGKTHLEKAGLAVQDYAGGKVGPDKVIVAGPGAGRALAKQSQAIAASLQAGTRLLVVGLEAQEANAFLPHTIATKKAEYISTVFEPAAGSSLLAGVGPADVLNRDPRPLPLISGGAAVAGNGVLATTQDNKVAFCQLAPWHIPYGDTYEDKRYFAKITFRRASSLFARLLGNMGAMSSTPLLSRFSSPVVMGIKKDDITDPLWLEKGKAECVLPLHWKGLPLGEDKQPPAGWMTSTFDDSKWRDIRVPGTWEDQFKDLAGMNGLFLYRVKFRLPPTMDTAGISLVLGAIDDEDWTYVNGKLVGSLTQKTNPKDYWKAIRRYAIPAGVLKAGENVLAVKVNDLRQAGGIKGLRTPRQEERLTQALGMKPSILKNGDFGEDADGDGIADGWRTEATGKATFTREKTPTGEWSTCIDCADPGRGKRPHVMLSQTGAPMKRGEWYTITLRAKAAGFTGNVLVAVQDTKTWKAIIEYQRFAPKGEWKEFSFKVAATATKMKHTRFQIWYTGTGKVWLADVRLQPTQPPWYGRWLEGLYLDKPYEMDDPYRFFRW